MTRLVVMIPAYNEEEDIAAVIQEIPRDVPGFDSVEVLVIDDGSTDNTAEVAQKAGADHILAHRGNRGLAHAFRNGLDAALRLGADVIVNTDADNHYDQSRIPELAMPVLNCEADIVIGSRAIEQLQEMPASRSLGNRLANMVFRFLYGLPPDTDISSGFRAYSREAALKLSITSKYTYTHESLISAVDAGLKITSIVIPARDVTRPSRLMSSVRSHVMRAGSVAFVSFAVYRLFRILMIVAGVLVVAGAIAWGRFFYLYIRDDGAGHIQSLVLASLLIILGVQLIIAAFFAAAMVKNRLLSEELLYQQRKAQFEPPFVPNGATQGRGNGSERSPMGVSAEPVGRD